MLVYVRIEQQEIVFATYHFYPSQAAHCTQTILSELHVWYRTSFLHRVDDLAQVLYPSSIIPLRASVV
jgi:hypothetical protein